MKYKLKGIHLGIIIAMCGVVGASVGINISAAGVFYNPISNALGVGKGAVSLTTTILSMLMALTCLAVPKILKKVKLKKVLWISVSLLVIGNVLCAFSNSLIELYIWNAMKGIGAGLTGFVLATTLINNWVYVNHGLITSIVMSFSGVAGVLFATPLSMVISKFGYQLAFFVMAAFIFVFYMPALFLPISIKPEEIGEKPYGYELYEEHLKTRKATELKTGAEMESSVDGSQFGILLVFTTLVCVIAAMFMHLSGYAEVLGLGSGLGAMLISTVNLANVCAKLVYGTLTDRIGTMKSSLIMGACSIIGLTGLLLFKQPALLVASSFLYGCTMPNSAVALSLSTKDIFGIDNYGRVYPIVNFVGSLTNSIGITAYGFLYDITQSYKVLFVFTLAMQAVAMITFILLYKRHKMATM